MKSFKEFILESEVPVVSVSSGNIKGIGATPDDLPGGRRFIFNKMFTRSMMKKKRKQYATNS